MDTAKPFVSATQLKRWISPKWTLRIVLGFVIVVSIVVAILYVHHRSEQTKAFNAAIQQANAEMTSGGQTAQPVALLLGVLPDAHTKAQKIKLYDALANAEANNGSPRTAIYYYGLKHQLDPASVGPDAYLLAQDYVQTGQAEQAIEQYKLAIRYLQSQQAQNKVQGPGVSLDAEIAQYTKALQSLEGQR